MDNGWNDYIEKIFIKWCEACALNSAIHTKASKYYTQWNNRFQLPSIILSTLTTSALFINLDSQNSQGWNYTTAVLSALASIFIALNRFYKYGPRALDHSGAGKSWEKLRIDMETILVLPRDRRPEGIQMLMDFKRKYKELKSAVSIPEDLMGDYLKGTQKQIEKYGIEVNAPTMELPATDGSDKSPSNSSDKLRLPEDIDGIISPKMNDVLYQTETLRKHKRTKSSQLQIVITPDDNKE